MFEPIVSFIRDLYRTHDYIPLHEPRFAGNEKRYLNDCIESTYVSSVGKFVDRFEEITAAYTGSKKAVVCVNGTAALHMALQLAGVSPGDEIITQPLTFIATANAIAYLSAHPVFIDVDLDTLGLSPTSMRNFLLEYGEVRDDGYCYNRKTGHRIKACVPMHTFGHPVRITEIAELCREFNISLVEDAAESIGSTFMGKHTGTFGELGILSFNGNKIITTGGGGMILVQDEETGRKAKHLTTQAKVPHPWAFFHDELGYNYRMPNVNAALGVAQMENLDIFLQKKRELALNYMNFFSQSRFHFFCEPPGAHSNYWLNTLVMEDEAMRDEFLEYTNKKGVNTRPAWSLMNHLPMYENCMTGNLEHSEWLQRRLVNIPSSIIL